MFVRYVLAIFAIMSLASLAPSYAQHHSGSTAPPIDLDGLKITLSTILFPEDFTYDDGKANLSIRLFDSETNVNVKSVTYRVQIFHEDNLVANEYFFDEDGKLDLEIRPTTGCQEQSIWKCTKYYGEKHAIAGGYYARGDSIPIIQGPVFDKSGQYGVKVSIVGATNPKTMTTKDLFFETFLYIPTKETFLIKSAQAQEFPISVKSYNNEITSFSYDESLKKITYEMSYDTENIQLHNSSHSQIISMPKNFFDFKQEYDLDIFVDGMKLEDNSFEFNVSDPNENIIRVNIPHEELLSLKSRPDNTNSAKVEILSGDQIQFNQIDFLFENGFTANVLWDSKLKTGVKIPFTFSFFDANGNLLKDALFAYSILDNSGKEIWSNIGDTETYLGILSPTGTAKEHILIPADGQYQLKLILTGQNAKNFESFLISKSDFSISQSVPLEKTIVLVPSWVKNNANWWAKGQIDDDSFKQGIQFMIKEKIINISVTTPQTTTSQDIPVWVKNNAGWWAEGLISEEDFVKGIEFLISNGIIKIN